MCQTGNCNTSTSPMFTQRLIKRSYSSIKEIKQVTVYGSGKLLFRQKFLNCFIGLMGAGIAQVAATSNYHVTMVDVNQEALTRGQNTISSSLKRIAKKKFESDSEQQAFIADIMSRVKTSTDPVDASRNSDLLVEAIVEDLQVKKKLFKSIDAVAPSSAIFASNTSSLPIRAIAEACPGRLSHFAGLHFFNPVPQMKLVEIVRISETSPQVVESLQEFCRNLQKSPVLCKDTPGYQLN